MKRITMLTLGLLLLASPSLLVAAGAQDDARQLHNDHVIAIDIGNTNVHAAILTEAGVEFIAMEDGRPFTPAIVSWKDDGSFVVGELTKNLTALNQTQTATGMMSLIGQNLKKPSSLERFILYRLLELVGIFNQDESRRVFEVEVGAERKTFTPQEMVTVIVENIGKVAAEKFGEYPHKVAVIIPDSFSLAQREAVQNACTQAGLKPWRVMTESGAAIHVLLEHKLDLTDKERGVVVLHLGGTTLEATLATIDSGVIEVWRVERDSSFGGVQFDSYLMKHYASKLKDEHNVEIVDKKSSMLKLRTAVEHAKHALSIQTPTKLRIVQLVEGFDFEETLTRDEFEQITKAAFAPITPVLDRLLKNAGVSKDEVEDVVLTGGSANIPRVQALIADYFNPETIIHSTDPARTAALGGVRLIERFYPWMSPEERAERDARYQEMMANSVHGDFFCGFEG